MGGDARRHRQRVSWGCERAHTRTISIANRTSAGPESCCCCPRLGSSRSSPQLPRAAAGWTTLRACCVPCSSGVGTWCPLAGTLDTPAKHAHFFERTLPVIAGYASRLRHEFPTDGTAPEIVLPGAAGQQVLRQSAAASLLASMFLCTLPSPGAAVLKRRDMPGTSNFANLLGETGPEYRTQARVSVSCLRSLLTRCIHTCKPSPLIQAACRRWSVCQAHCYSPLFAAFCGYLRRASVAFPYMPARLCLVILFLLTPGFPLATTTTHTHTSSLFHCAAAPRRPPSCSATCITLTTLARPLQSPKVPLFSRAMWRRRSAQTFGGAATNPCGSYPSPCARAVRPRAAPSRAPHHPLSCAAYLHGAVDNMPRGAACWCCRALSDHHRMHHCRRRVRSLGIHAVCDGLIDDAPAKQGWVAWAATSHRSPTCSDQPMCGAGQYLKPGADAILDRDDAACLACATNRYTSGTTGETTCAEQPPCGPGYYARPAGTFCSEETRRAEACDVVCGPCAPWFHQPPAGLREQECYALTTTAAVAAPSATPATNTNLCLQGDGAEPGRGPLPGYCRRLYNFIPRE